MPKTIERLAADLLNDPVRVAVEPVASVVDTIEQRLCYVEKPEKKQALISALKENDGRSVLVFSRTKHGADASRGSCRRPVSVATRSTATSRRRRASAPCRISRREKRA